MRSWLMLLVAVAVGAATFFALDRFAGKGDATSPGEPAAPGGAVLEGAASLRGESAPPADPGAETKGATLIPPRSVVGVRPKPRFFVGRPEEEPPRAPNPPPAGAPAGGVTAREEPAAPRPAVEPPPGGTAGTGDGLQRDRRLAYAALDSGEKERGLRILRGIYVYAKDRPGVDLSTDVRRLLNEETDRERKLEYLSYLARGDRRGALFQTQLESCAGQLARAEEGPELALATWDDLTLAYELAGTRQDKEQAMALLQPFIQRMILSGRYTPLLKSYTIKSGDNLVRIARRHKTTANGLMRINRLTSDKIQPRQRLRILPGELEIFVDKSDFVLWATVDGRVLMEFPVGLGRDNSTPVGTFKVKDRLKDPTWFRPGMDPLPPGDPENILGTRWLGFEETAEYAGFGIHGTPDPKDLGAESSAGCIRLRKDDVELLFDFVDLGTQVTIRA